MPPSPSLYTIARFAILPVVVFVFIFSFSLFFLSSSLLWQKNFAASPLLSTTGTTYYISPTGSDSNSGTSSSAPLKTFVTAIPKLQAGDTLYLLDGTYIGSITGNLNINCGTGGNAVSGTASLPITVRSLNERKGYIHGDGSDLNTHPVSIVNCSYWDIVGLRMDNPYFTGKGTETVGNPGYVLITQGSDHINIKRNLAEKPDTRYNSMVMSANGGSSYILFEENEVYNFHRHGIDAYNAPSGVSMHITFRRNYVNDRSYGSLGPGSPTAPITIYAVSDNIEENNIMEGGQENGSTGNNNKFLGNMMIGLQDGYLASCWYGLTTNELYINNVSVNGNIGFASRSETSGTYLSNSAIGNSSAGFSADNEYNTHPIDCTNPAGTTFSPNLVYRNNLSLNNGGSGVVVVTSNGPVTAILDFFNSFGNGGGGNYSSGTSGKTNSLSVNPNLGSCKVWIPAGSPMKGAGLGGADIGANILYRYQDGVLTNQPLWDPTTGEFPHGAIIAGVNDIAGSSAFDVHKRLNVGAANGCPFPAGYTLTSAPTLTLSAAPLTITSGQAATLTWSATNATSCTASGGWSGTQMSSASQSVSPTTTTTYTLQCSGAGGSTSQNVTVTVNPAASQSPVAWWKFDEGSGTSAADASGNGNAGTLLNNPGWINGILGSALSFNGTTQSVSAANSSSLDITTTGLSISLWARALNPGSYSYLVSKRGPNSTGYALDTGPSGTLRFYLGTGSSQLSPDTLTSPWDGNWHHLVGTYDGSMMRVYIDGVQKAVGSATGTILSAAGIPLRVGTYDGTANFFPGALDDVRIYNRALLASEVQALYAAVPQPTTLSNLSFTPSLEGKTTLPVNTSFTLSFYTPGSTLLQATATMTSDTTGKLSLPSSVSLVSGSYDILTATSGYLKKKQLNVSLVSNTTLTLNQLTSADLNSDNVINSLDWSVMNANWFAANSIADINGDGIVNSLDFSYLNSNWNKVGD